MLKRAALMVLLALGLLSGCGGHKTHHPSPPTKASILQAPLSVRCPVGGSRMGCSAPILPSAPFAHVPAASGAAGALFSDVYEGQGDVNWGAVKGWQQSHGWRPGGIFKMGEYRIDSKAARNNSELRARGMWRGGYWFIRATGCQSEANQIISAARSYGLRLVALDVEVPEANGYAPCLAPKVQAAGFVVVTYGGSGTWPGGGVPSTPFWLAAYTSRQDPWCSFFTCAHGAHGLAAWQFTDGQFGSPTQVPGIDNGRAGYDDVNIDYGISSLALPPVDPYAIFPQGPFYLDGKWINERATARAWDDNHCKAPARRAICVRNADALKLLAARIWFVAHHAGDKLQYYRPRGDWGAPRYLGPRLALINARINPPVAHVASLARDVAAVVEPVSTHPVYYPAGGWLAPGTPISWQHNDQGKDLVIPWRGIWRAPGDGVIVAVGSDRAFPNGFGPNYPEIRIDTGPWRGATYYLGHTSSLVSTGQRVHFGTALAVADQGTPGSIGYFAANPPGEGGGWTEFGQVQPSGALGPFSPGGHWYDGLLRTAVVLQVPDPPINRGQRNWRVYGMTAELQTCGYLNRSWFTYNQTVAHAVTHFKRHHTLYGPGDQVGAVMQAVLASSARQCRATRTHEVSRAD